jgi:four helix bundle protein
MAIASTTQTQDRLESFGIYQLALQLFQAFWTDSEILGKDYRGRELVKQQVRSLDSIAANIEEGFGRGFGKELPQHLKIARGEARESRGRYLRCHFLLSPDVIQQRVAVLDHIIGGLTNTIHTIEAKQKRMATVPATRHPSPATRHAP